MRPSGLSTSEVLAFGEGVALPVRLVLKQLSADLLPKSEALGQRDGAFAEASHDFLASVLERWRGATMSGKSALENPAAQEPGSSIDVSPPLQPVAGSLHKPSLRGPHPSFASEALPIGKR